MWVRWVDSDAEWLQVARAQASNLVLEWDAPADCPDAAYVRGQVERLLGGGKLSATARLVARARAARFGQAWQVHLTTQREGSPAAERKLQAESCRSLADATALIIAVAVDPASVAAARAAGLDASVALAPDAAALDAGIDAPEEAPPPALVVPTGEAADAADAQPPEAGGPPSPRAPAESAPSPPAPPEPAGALPRLGGIVGIEIAGDLGTLPGAAYGVIADAGLRLGSWRALGRGFFWPPVHGSAAGSTGGGDFELLGGALNTCYAFPWRDVEVGPCAGLEAGSLRGSGTGVGLASSGSGLWLAATAGGLGMWRFLPAWALRLELGAAVPLRRDRFVLDNVGFVHQAAPVSGRAALGAELRF